MTPDYYHVLGVPEDASTLDIKKAYRRLALRYHPDKNPSADAHAKFIEINEAYLILSDDEARRRYDATRVHDDPHRAYRQRSNSGSAFESTRTDDGDLDAWIRNAQRQAQQYAAMDYARFAKLVGDVVSESALQFGTAVVYAVSAVLFTSGFFGFFIGLVDGNAGQAIVAAIIGAMGLGGFFLTSNRFDPT